jgi:2-dehydropantoate 2-reductase
MGAGGLGGYYGGLLAAGGHTVTFIARGAHLEAIRRTGGVRVRAVHGEFFGPGAAAERIRPAVGPQTAILSLQNGVDNEEVLAREYGADRILGGLVYIFASIGEPGMIAQTGGPRRVVFGEWSGRRSDRIARLEEAFRQAGWLVEGCEDIVREKWVKFAFICAQAGMTALTRLPIGDVRATPPTWEMFRQIVEEVVAVGRARGVRLGQEVIDAHLAFAQSLEPAGLSSLYHDLTHGHRLEIEALHGTVVRYGRDAGVPTPASQAVYAALLPHDRLARRGGGA